MRVPTSIRFVAVTAAALVFIAAGCNRGNDDEATPTPADSTTPAPDVEAAGDFQLVGTVEQAFVGEEPEIDLPSASSNDSLGTSSTASPQATASGDFVTTSVNGIMRISLEDTDAELRQTCSADRDEDIEVFWTTGTEFSRRLIGTDVEESLDRRLVGVTGNLFVGPRPNDDGLSLGESTQAPTTASATASADATTADDRGCVLIADQVATSTGAIPTARPARTARPTTAPAATKSPTPKPTKAPTPKPTTTPPPSAPPTSAAPT